MSNRLEKIVWSVTLPGLFASGCGRTAEPASPPLPAATSLSTASDLNSKDEIDGLDLAPGSSGALHLVWRERYGLYGGNARHDRILYRRGHGRPLRWDPPIVISDKAIGTPQVAIASDGVHVFAGAHLTHWALPEGGGPVSARGDMLGSEAPLAGAFDAVGIGDAVTIFYLASDRSRDRNAYSLRWSADAGTSSAVVETLSPGAPAVQPLPRLLSGAGNALAAVWANNSLVERLDDRTGVTTYRSGGHVHAAWSRNGGRSWERVGKVTTTPLASPVGAVTIAGTPAAPVIAYGATSLLFSRWGEDGWEPPITLIKPEFFSAGSRAAIAATQCAEGFALTWTDKRNQGTDRRWWKPLGGVPWSDSPDWINNDLFVLLGNAATRALAGEPASPRRLTVSGSLTSEVAIAHRDGELIVLRVGRADARKSPDDAGAMPAIEQSSIPCD